MALVMGLDCGGSKTRALVLDESGAEVFRGAGGPANIASTSEEVMRKSLQEAVGECPRVEAVAGCFAGLLTQGDQDRAEAILQDLFPSAKVRAWPDYAGALAADPEIDGIMICGTGSVCAWWDKGEIKKYGGGGPLLGDAASAFALGKAILSAALHGSPSTRSPNLVRHLDERFGTQDMNEVVAAIYRSEQPPAEIAKAAKVAIEDWEMGWERSDVWIDQFLMGVLMQLSGAVSEGSRIGVTGGVWKLSPRLFPRLLEVDQEMGINLIPKFGVRIRELDTEPVLGAANLARQLLSS